jgi:hypothetical protein
MGMMGGGMFNDPAMLLGMEPVQKELELSDDQKAKVTQLSADSRQGMQELFQLSPEERQTKMAERAKESKKKLCR